MIQNSRAQYWRGFFISASDILLKQVWNSVKHISFQFSTVFIFRSGLFVVCTKKLVDIPRIITRHLSLTLINIYRWRLYSEHTVINIKKWIFIYSYLLVYRKELKYLLQNEFLFREYIQRKYILKNRNVVSNMNSTICN